MSNNVDFAVEAISRFFDEKYYSSQVGIDMSKQEAAEHYIRSGWEAGLNPSPSFVTNYYLSKNQDVRLEKINPLFHYAKWGMYEGRSPNPREINRVYNSNEQYVADYFDKEYYLSQYKQVAENDVDPLKHYFNFGWRQGFNPSADFNTNEYIAKYEDVDFDKINPLLHKVISDKRQKHLDQYSKKYYNKNFDDETSIQEIASEIRTRRDRPYPWEKYLVAHEFVAMNQHYTPYISDYTDILAVFLHFGIKDIAPLSFKTIFDYEFYTINYPDVRELSPIEAYRHWLYVGSVGHRFCSEESLLEALIGRRKFPEAFDWIKYQENNMENHSNMLLPRWHCLEHLLDHGFKANKDIPTKIGNRSELYEIISDRMWSLGERELAIQALKKSIMHEQLSLSGQQPGHLLHKIGDYYKDTSKPHDALISYTSAIANGYADLWTFLNIIYINVNLKDFPVAYECLRQSQDRFSGDSKWRNALDHVIRSDFEQGSTSCRQLFAAGKDKDAEALMKNTLVRVTSAVEELEGLPARTGSWPDGPVIFFALTSVPQCKHYRVDQRIQQLEAADIDYKLYNGSQPVEAKENLIGARALIIYREPAFPDNIRLIMHARALGIPVYYDIDDLIFNLDYYPDSYDTYKDQIEYDSYIGLKYASPLYKYAIELSDFGVSSTTTLAGYIEPLTRQKKCFHIPNGIDNRNSTFINNRISQLKSDKIRIFYGSGAKAHNRNFNECVAPALAQLMNENKNIEIFIAGYLTLSPEMQKYSDRVHTIDFTKDITLYWSLLEQMDINIATLIGGIMNDCKSEIKWIEAACCGVASILSASKTYREIINDDHDAILVYEPSEWYKKLKYLVENPDLRLKIVENARKKLNALYSLPTLSRRVSEMLEYAVKVLPPIDINPRKMRIIVVNVLFNPQSYGGATRVVENEVNDLRERYGSDVEVAVFTTDYMGSAGRTKVDNYNGIPVFRFAPFLHDPYLYNEDAPADYFAEVLDQWKPDIVHIHSVQYLTASLASRLVEKKIPYVITIHDGWWFSQDQFFVDRHGFTKLPGIRSDVTAVSLDTLRREHVMKFCLGSAFALTTVSSSFAAICAKAGFEDVIVIENGANRFDRSEQPLLPKIADKVVIGFVGGRAMHKGYHLVRAALTLGKFDKITLVLVDHERHADFRETEVWGETEVRVIGVVKQAKMGELYESLDVLCAPSIWPESFGLVAREASSIGLWVIANKIGGMGEEITSGENGFVIDTTTLEDLNACLSQINDDPLRFKKRVTPRFDQEAGRLQTDKLLDLFKKAVIKSR